MLGENEPVGAGDLDMFVLERADDGFKQFAALAHQNENIAITRGAAIDADRFAAFDQAAHRARDALGEFHPRASLADGVERRVPAFDIRAFVGLGRLPDFD